MKEVEKRTNTFNEAEYKCIFTFVAICLFVCCTEPSGAHEQPRASTAKHEHAAEGTDNDEHEPLRTVFTLDAKVEQRARLRTQPASKVAISETLVLSGELQADPDRSAEVSSPVGGKLLSVHFREGATVKRGELLATIAIPEMSRVRAAASAASARAVITQKNATRQRELFEKKLTSEQSVQEAEAEAVAANAESTALAEQLRALGTPSANGTELNITAPKSGTVLMRHAIVGQPVGPNDVIATIADLESVWFIGRAFERDLALLNVGVDAEVELNAYPGETFYGKVAYIGQQVDPVARTVTARIVLSNSKRALRLGLFGRATVERKPIANQLAASHLGRDKQAHEKDDRALAVPRSAVMTINNAPFVFVRTAPQTYEAHAVVLGKSGLFGVLVEHGVSEGEEVVVDGAFTLKSLMLRHTFEEDEHGEPSEEEHGGHP